MHYNDINIIQIQIILVANGARYKAVLYYYLDLIGKRSWSLFLVGSRRNAVEL